jgi:puromycin-sensitive aminopeptidase
MVLPLRYTLELEPDLAAARFTGHVEIDVDVKEPVEEIVLNAAELEIDGVEVESGGDVPVEFETDDAAERLILHPAAPVDPGRATIRITFRGILNDQLRGFYRSTFTDDDGREQVIATTQFQAADARRAFPCWDEPDFKSVFAVSLVVDPEMLAVSNGPEVDRTPTGGGKLRIRFAPTMKMSTYLVAFVVGPLVATDPIEVHGVPLRIVHLPGKRRLAAFALEAGKFALEHLVAYYGIPYPADKLDLIGLPDFAWGAMENLGAITFRESALLIDPDRVGQEELSRVADVIAHEIAHMWFGDLVTMKWWNGIWLNEAFATFMEMKVTDAFRPGWKRWLGFATEPGIGRATSMDIDALEATRPVEFPVETPEEADEMFDALTYGKGAAIVRMLEQFLGEDVFRIGIRDYLHWYSHGNTDTDDLWGALATASGRPVGPMMEGWVFRPGYPRIDVRPAPGGGGFSITQDRFRYRESGEAGDGDTWVVPLLYRTGEESDLQRLELSAPGIVPSTSDWIVANAGGHGYYRVRYAPELREELLGRLASLDPLERFGLIADEWAFVLAGDEPAAEYVAMAAEFRRETEPVIWEALLGGFDALHRFLGLADRPAIAAAVEDLVSEQADRLGWEPARREDDLVRRRRRTLHTARGTLAGHGPTREQARDVFDRIGKKAGGVDPDAARAAVAIVAATGTSGEFEECADRYRTAATPQDEMRYLRALAEFPLPDLVARTFDMVLSGAIRSQDGPGIVGRLLANRGAGDAAWRILAVRWDDLMGVMPPLTAKRILDGVPALAAFGLEAEVEAFFAEHPIRAGGRYLQQQLERLRVRAALRDRENGSFAGGRHG